jgi:flagellar motor component MotA
MNSIDELERPEKIEKLLRLVVMGRVDAAIKLAELLESELQKLEATKKKVTK